MTEVDILKVRLDNARSTIDELKRELAVLYSKVAYYESNKGTGDIRSNYGGPATRTVG